MAANWRWNTNYGFGLSGRSVPPQVDSDKLRMNCIAKHKCTVSQKLDTRRRGEKLNAISHGSSLILSGVCLTVVLRTRTCIFFAFFVFDLFYVRQDKRQKILLLFWNSLSLSNVCVNIATRRIGYSITRRLIRFNNNIPWITQMFVFVYFWIQVKHQKIWLLLQTKSYSVECLYYYCNAATDRWFTLPTVYTCESFCRVVVFIL